MFSLTPGADPKKKKNDPMANQPLTRKGRKQAAQFAKGVTRFLRYNKDLLPEQKIDTITGMRDEFVDEIRNSKKIRSHFEKKAEEISKFCEKAIPDFRPSVLKENIEVLFVAVVIAMGIRAYFIQQFKIPTGSMQPTLNGIIAFPAPEMASSSHPYRTPEDYKFPNPVKRIIDSVWFGRSHVEWKAKEDGDAFLLNRDFDGKSKFILFPRSYLSTAKGHRYSASGTASRVIELIDRSKNGQSLKKGEVIARGFIQTGDMLIVNKLTYHWRNPKRGEVFVFNTRDIPGIQRNLDNPNYGSQHYIKRLCGVPGDNIQVQPPNLIVNGEPAKEPGIRRVMSAEGLYEGYSSGYLMNFQLRHHEYLALGDNSPHSLDSRSWGTVPERNIVGKAMFVFYPFGNHFGPIK